MIKKKKEKKKCRRYIDTEASCLYDIGEYLACILVFYSEHLWYLW